MQRTLSHSSREILSVSKLTRHIKTLLEDKFSLIWVTGEISNLRIPASGHAYFSLKDDKSQISTVMFKGQLRQLTFKLDDGANIIGLGRLSVYEPRGTYQIILEYIEPHGIGALQIAYEQLKKKLASEGLFDPGQKSELPMVPQKIGVITSPSGAVIKDILRIIGRRYPDMSVDIFPVRVQGNNAIEEIVNAVSLANTIAQCDLIILARGGGSFEDMAAFNSESVARAVFSSQLPVVSAIGHETDFSITDFVADLRAPTPSAAAEMVVPVKSELVARCNELYQRCRQSIVRAVSLERVRVNQATKGLGQIFINLQAHQLRHDDLSDRLYRSATLYLERKTIHNDKFKQRLLYNSPDRYISIYKSKHELLRQRLRQEIDKKISHSQGELKTVQVALGALNPTAILQRGYSITRTLPQKNIVKDPNQVNIDAILDIQLAKGSIEVSVKKRTQNK